MSEKLPKHLMELIKNGENATVEFKESKNEMPKNLFETVCAFLNRNGGHIFLGVSDNGIVKGVKTENLQIITNNKEEFYKFM